MDLAMTEQQTAASRPTLVESDLTNLPAALKPLTQMPHWVLWRLELNEKNKWTKVPYQTNGREAKTNTPSTWSTYQQCIAALSNGGDYSGIGFCLLNSGYAAFDGDKCRDKETRELKPYAKKLIERCNSYAEVSPSGTGVRIIGPGIGDRLYKGPRAAGDGSFVETYRNAEKYVTITGLSIGASQMVNIDAVIDAVPVELDQMKAQQGGPSQGDGGGEQLGDLSEQLTEMLNIADPGAGNSCGDYASRSSSSSPSSAGAFA